MFRKCKAIRTFEKQRSKIDSLPTFNEDLWRDETSEHIKKYLGNDFRMYQVIKDHSFFAWNPGNILTHDQLVADEENQRKRGKEMLDVCINHIKTHGIKTETNWLYTIPFNKILIGIVAIVLFSIGIGIHLGQYDFFKKIDLIKIVLSFFGVNF